MNHRPRLIAVAGIIGVGKTTLAEHLAGVLGGRLICEQYDQNPFLADQLAGDRDAALASELFFMFSRVGQLNHRRLANDETAICDYIYEKNRLFARMNLDEESLRFYDRLEQTVLPHLTPVTEVIYLTDTVENCLDRIRRRGRAMEMRIQASWLTRLQREYDTLFNAWDRCPVVRVDCSRCDVRQIDAVRFLAQRLSSEETMNAE